MGTTNYGKQIIRFKYSQPATSQSFNHLLYNILPVGIYSGGTLTKVTNSSIKVSELTCFIKDSSFTYEEDSDLYNVTAQGIASFIETTDEVTINVTAATPYIVLNLDWANAVNNYMDIFAKSKTWVDANPDALVLGRVIYDAGVIDTTFDYTLRDDAPLSELNDVRDYFKVVPTEPISDQIKVTAGKFKSNNDIINFSETTSSAISDTTTNPRTDIVYIDSNGDVQIEEGLFAPTAPVPDYKGRFVIAEIYREAGRTTVAGNEITQVYNRYIPETIQEITYENGYEFYGSKTLKGYTDCSDIFTVCTQGTGCRAIVGIAGYCCGVYGCATCYGVYGSANHYGVYGCASSYGVYGCATGNVGVRGSASGSCGVYGNAGNYAIYGYATTCYGVYGCASYRGVYGCATSNIGIYGYSDGNTGILGCAAGDYGVVGCATNQGVCGCASCCLGAVGIADFHCGVYGQASYYGIRACAINNWGVYTQADYYGVWAYASVDDGVYGCADRCYGVRGIAANWGVYGCATACYGVRGCADNAYGVYGQAPNCYGVYGCSTSAISVGGNTGYNSSSNKYQKIQSKNICILDCLRNNYIPVHQWLWEDSNYRGFSQFISPYAQDIKDVFDLTDDDDKYFTLDGIAFGIGQELLQEVDKLKDEIEDLKEQLKYGN